MAQIGPALLSLLQHRAYCRAHIQRRTISPAAVSGPDADMTLHITILFKGAINELRKLGFDPGIVIGQVSFGAIKLEALEELATHPQVVSIEQQRRQHLSPDRCIPAAMHINPLRHFSGGYDYPVLPEGM